MFVVLHADVGNALKLHVGFDDLYVHLMLLCPLQVNSKTEFGTELAWAAGSSATKFGIAAKYTMAPGSVYRVC